MVVKNDESSDAEVIDLIKFKIEKELKKTPKGSAEYDTLAGILRMYEEGIVTVKWSHDDMWVSMEDGSDIPADILDYPDLKEDLHRLRNELAELFPEDED
jgi:hypothetical protein